MVALATLAMAAAPQGLAGAQQSYLLYVASESADEVALLRFTPGDRLVVEKVIPVGFWPAEMEGPHGINLDPRGTHWYLTLAHTPPVFGRLLKYRAGADTLEGSVVLGQFPATLAVSPGGFAFVVNFNLHGEHVPSTVSVVDVATMTELERIETCTMPHGSRLSPDGGRHYSGCMMDDELVEIDALALEVARRLDVSPAARAAAGGRGHVGAAGHSRGAAPLCAPTWAAPSPDGRYVYVPCNRHDEVLEVDVEGWAVTRRFASPSGPYNAEVTPDGERLVVTQKGSGEVSIWDLATGERVALIPNTRKVTHGVAIPPDGRYAFVSVEGVGGQPGAVDVIDLRSLTKVTTVDVGQQAGGIVFWKKEGR